MTNLGPLASRQAERSSVRLGVAVALVVAAAMVTWPMIFAGSLRGRGAYDQVNYHLPVIRQFVQQWPAVDLVNYQSATSPGYHLILAAVGQMIGVGRGPTSVGLQLAGSVFTLGLVGLLGWALAGRTGRRVGGRWSGWWGGLLTLPFACSVYVLVPGVWIQPDGAAWLLVLALVLMGLRERRMGLVGLAMMGGLVACLVMVRQIHIWSAAIVWMKAWLDASPVEQDADIWRNIGARVRATLPAVVVTLPAFGILAWLVSRWDGLTPPDFQIQHGSGINLATPAFGLSLVTGCSVFFAGLLWPELKRMWKGEGWLGARGWWLVVVAAGLGAGLALIGPTTYVMESRSGGLWRLVKAMDDRGWVLMGRTSPLLLVLAPVGAVALAVWLSLVAAPARWMLGWTMLAFIAAQSANSNAWQRYLEPMGLMVLMIIAAQAWPRDWSALGRVRRVVLVGGVVCLAGVLAGISAVTIARGSVQDRLYNEKAAKWVEFPKLSQ